MYNEIIGVTNRKLCKNKDFYSCIDNALKDNVKYLILREKDLNVDDYTKLGIDVNRYLENSNTKLILNVGNAFEEDEIYMLIDKTKCSNIHIPMYMIEKLKDFNKLRKNVDVMGIPVHSLEEGMKAQTLGADYIVAGHIFETKCKENIPPKGIKFIKEICDNIEIDVYGIGGINRNNAMEVINVGAKGVCIMSGYFN